MFIESSAGDLQVFSKFIHGLDKSHLHSLLLRKSKIRTLTPTLTKSHLPTVCFSATLFTLVSRESPRQFLPNFPGSTVVLTSHIRRSASKRKGIRSSLEGRPGPPPLQINSRFQLPSTRWFGGWYAALGVPTKKRFKSPNTPSKPARGYLIFGYLRDKPFLPSTQI